MVETEQTQATSPLQVTALFRHDCEGYPTCPPRWTAFRSHEEEETDCETRMAKIPIVHRHAFDDKRWETLNFTINDVNMQNLLAKAFEGYQGLDMKLEHWTFSPPYRPLVHRWNQVNEIHAGLMNNAETPDDEKQAFQTLLDFLRPIMAASIEALAQTRDTGMIHFDDVWKIFPPSELIVAKLWGLPLICKVLKYKLKRTMQETYWRIQVKYVDWNGSRCGYVETSFLISFYRGLRHVNSLEVYPLSFHKDPEALRGTFLDRGKKFEGLRGYHFQNYTGSMRLLQEDDRGQERPIDGRVIVDAFAYYFSQNLVQPALRSLTGDDALVELDEPRQNSRASTGSRSRSRGSVVSSSPSRSPSPSSFVEDTDQRPQKGDVYGRDEDKTALTDEQLLMIDPRLIGFDLKSKQWGELNIDDLEDVIWNYDAFQHLVLPEDEKQLAWDFVESKASSSEDFDDFIKDKGRGLVFLMFGPPGVGKTFTAEAVAERANVPLYAMSASMLGSEPTEIGTNLDSALTLCKLWNAMLLLDEADVFMAARSSNDIKRNELVSIFLTKLEYYPGILFLTTNRAADIDFAFQSRVDLFLPYHELTPEARRQIWNNFIERAGRAQFLSSGGGDLGSDLDKISQLSLNGREIKNLVKTSQLLSQKNGGVGTMERLYMLAEKRVKALALLANGER